jgi:hypothetical protein
MSMTVCAYLIAGTGLAGTGQDGSRFVGNGQYVISFIVSRSVR